MYKLQEEQIFLNNSKCASCKKMNKVSRPQGYMGRNGNLALKGYCPSCNKIEKFALY